MTRNKYGNQKTTVGHHTFDSQKEANDYLDLWARRLSGEISELTLQPRFILQEGYTNKRGEKVRPIEYRADFMYYDNERRSWVVRDSKGVRTQVFKLKAKLFCRQYVDSGPGYIFEVG